MASTNTRDELKALGQVVLVFQGGGALGAYQAGVYQALHETGVEPDWVIGTSIGAINASIIAGNEREQRMDALRAFWKRVELGDFFGDSLPGPMAAAVRNFRAVAGGIGAFFNPNPLAFMSPHFQLGAENAGYYSTDALAATLGELVDFDRINACKTRLTVGASNISSSEMTYFDSRDMPLDVRHVQASGALPPAFPPVRIGDDLFWDGGIMSNTPVEAVFDDNPRRSSVVFAVHLWNPHGAEPRTIWEVMNRQKDVQYASRATGHIRRQRQIHRMRHIIAELAAKVPETERDNMFAEMKAYGCLTRMHVVRLLSPTLEYEDHAKDIDFSPSGIAARWTAGYEHTLATLETAPWRDPVDPLEGFVLHEACAGHMVTTEAAA